MRHLFSMLLCCVLFGSALRAQVTIVPLPSAEGRFTLDELWQVNIISPQSVPLEAVLEVSVEDRTYQTVFSAVSPPFLLRQGANRPAFSGSGIRSKFGSVPSAGALRSTGRLPYGQYVICYKLYSGVDASTMLGEYCGERTVQPFSPPELMSPYDREVVNTPMPILTWRPPFPPGSMPFDYSIRVVALRPGQDAISALEKNPPLLSRRITRMTQLPWPGDVPRLQTKTTYAWQVVATAGDFNLGATEVWTFTIGEAESVAESLPPTGNFRSFPEVKDTPGNGYTPIRKGKLKFAFDNRYAATNLVNNSAVPNLSNQSGTDVVLFLYPEGRLTQPFSFTSGPMSLITGMNQVEIALPPPVAAPPPGTVPTGFVEGRNYLLVVRDVAGKEYYLDFIYSNN